MHRAHISPQGKDREYQEYTLADWRKIFEFSKKDGKNRISAYRGEGPRVSVPTKTGKYPVVSFRLCDENKENTNLMDVVIENGIEVISGTENIIAGVNACGASKFRTA